MSTKSNWRKLKEEYLSGDINSVSSFLANKNIKRNGYVSRVTRGWNEARWTYQAKLRSARQEETIKRTSKIEAEFNAKRLKIARNLQLKGLRALQNQEPETASQSVRMLAVGLKEEREATGIGNKNSNSHTKIEPAYLKTRFARDLMKALEDMADEKFKELIVNIMNTK